MVNDLQCLVRPFYLSTFTWQYLKCAEREKKAVDITAQQQQATKSLLMMNLVFFSVAYLRRRSIAHEKGWQSGRKYVVNLIRKENVKNAMEEYGICDHI